MRSRLPPRWREHLFIATTTPWQGPSLPAFRGLIEPLWYGWMLLQPQQTVRVYLTFILFTVQSDWSLLAKTITDITGGTMPTIPGDFPRHVLRSQDLTLEHIEYLMNLADVLRSIHQHGKGGLAQLKMLLTEVLIYLIFYEPSTRTRISFETAGKLLGATVIHTESAGAYSSAKKGETLADTIRTLCAFHPTVIVLRHTDEGSSNVAAQSVWNDTHIINAGDGSGQQRCHLCRPYP